MTNEMMKPLTPQQAMAQAMREVDLQGFVLNAARVLGYLGCHFRP